MHFFAEGTRLRINTIIPNAIGEDKYYVFDEFFYLEVVMLFQVFPNSSKVHWFRDYIKIIWNMKFFWINWLVENPCSTNSHHGLNHSRGSLFPVIENLCTIISFGVCNCLNFLFIEEEFCNFRMDRC